MSLGAVLAGAAIDALPSVMAGGVNSLGQAAINARSARRSYKFTKRLMAHQFEYQQKAFEAQNARQDYLLSHQYEINRQALKNAGYSAADPDGVGVSTPQVGNMDTPSANQFAYPENKLDLLTGAQIMKTVAEAKKTEADTKFQDMQNELYAKYGESQITAALRNMDEDTRKKHEEALYTDQQRLNSIALTENQVAEIEQRIDINWKKLDPELQLLAAEAHQAKTAGNLNEKQLERIDQDIRESQKRIELMQSEIGLNNAQIDVAIVMAKQVLPAQAENYEASAGLSRQETKTEGYKTSYQLAETELKQLERDIETGLGINAHLAKRVAETVFPVAAIFAAFGKLF